MYTYAYVKIPIYTSLPLFISLRCRSFAVGESMVSFNFLLPSTFLPSSSTPLSTYLFYTSSIFSVLLSFSIDRSVPSLPLRESNRLLSFALSGPSLAAVCLSTSIQSIRLQLKSKRKKEWIPPLISTSIITCRYIYTPIYVKTHSVLYIYIYIWIHRHIYIYIYIYMLMYIRTRLRLQHVHLHHLPLLIRRVVYREKE